MREAGVEVEKDGIGARREEEKMEKKESWILEQTKRKRRLTPHRCSRFTPRILVLRLHTRDPHFFSPFDSSP